MRYLLLLLTLPFLLGASAGPQVLDDLGQRRFARGPWVSSYESDETFALACDMTSDTCSDGRKISTTRSTPVPCETSPGVWEMVGPNEGCYGVRGLESWATTTSYLSYGAELDRSPWRRSSLGTTVEALPRGYRITGTASDSRALQGGIPSIPGPHTLACVLRTDEPGTHTRLRIWWGSGPIIPVPVTSTWATYSILQTVPEDAPENTSAHVYSGVGTVDVIGCWLTRTDTPGRACWGGEAPVTCARDFHRLPATGFPATRGEFSWVMSLERVPDGGEALRGIVWADGDAVPNRISLTGGGGIRIYTGETAYITEPLSWEPGRSYRLQLILTDDEWQVVRDGALVGSTPPLGSMDWGATVRLGDLLDGSISSLRVRSAE